MRFKSHPRKGRDLSSELRELLRDHIALGVIVSEVEAENIKRVVHRPVEVAGEVSDRVETRDRLIVLIEAFKPLVDLDPGAADREPDVAMDESRAPALRLSYHTPAPAYA